MARKGFTTGIGEFKYPHLTKPDTKYTPEGVFKVTLVLDGEAAQKLKAQVDVAVEEAFLEEGKSLSEADRRKAQRYFPYEVDESEEDGTKTGYIAFHAKQRSKIKLKDGTIKDITIPIYDSANNPMGKDVDIWGGSKGRLSVVPRAVVLKTGRPIKIGVQLAIAQVQIAELRTGGAAPAFGAIEGGYVAPRGGRGEADEVDGAFEGEGGERSSSPPPASASQNSDY